MVLLVGPTVGLHVAQASEPVVPITIDSAAWDNTGPTVANIADGNCVSNASGAANGMCTLRAAVTVANAVPTDMGRVLITVDPSIGTTGPQVMTDWPGTATARNAMRMNTSAENFFESSGALFRITRPNVTIDLDNRLIPDGSVGDTGEHDLFRILADNIEMLNIEGPLSSGTSFAIGPNVRNILIDGTANGSRSTARTVNWGPERFVLIREGAQNVTVRGYDLSGFYDLQTSTGLFMFQAAIGTLTNPIPVRDVLIYDINVVNPIGTGACSGTNGSGCRARLTNFVGTSSINADRLRIENLTFRNIFVQGMNNDSTTAAGSNIGRLSQILDFTNGWNGTAATSNSPTIVNLTVEESVFANNEGQPQLHRAVIALPPGGRLRGTTIIRNNLFSTTASGRAAINIPSAPTGNQGANSVVVSQIFIYDNHFDGFDHAGGVVHGWRTGTVTMERNTFSRGGGADTTQGEESISGTGGGGMIRNRDNTANRNLLTWFPTGTAAVVDGTPAADALKLELNNRFIDENAPTCAVMLTAQAPTAAATGQSLPGTPVTLDVFWTENNRAELHIGRVRDVTEASAQILIDLPVGTIDLPSTNLPPWSDPIANTTAVISNPVTGAVNGSLRIQTQVEGAAQLQSSQLSRTVPLVGNCIPVLTINQAASQVDPTLVRFLDFTVTSTVPLRDLPASAIVLDAQPTTSTIEAASINPRVVEIIGHPDAGGSYGRLFTVRVAVDDSSRVTATIPTGVVQSVGGLPSLVPASFTDNEITFINPITLSPNRFSVVTGQVVPGSNPEKKAETPYHLAIRSTAPKPTADLHFAVTVTQPGNSPALLLSDAAPIIPGGTMISNPVWVRAEAGFVAAATEARINHAVTSLDPNYDGLMVGSVRVNLFFASPYIQIHRTAYINVPEAIMGTPGNMADPAAVIANGLAVPSGSRLLVGQPICFVWTVTNTSRDDWATDLTNVEVWDTDTRLGVGGYIGTIDVLGIDEDAQFRQCTTLNAIDSRPGGGS